jgi:hypothetical protein
MNKKYVCYWGEGYDNNTDIVDLDFFFPERGYSQEDIQAVTNLAVGVAVNLSDPSGTHYVLRVE